MPPEREKYIAALQDSHLFRSLDEEQIAQVVGAMEYGVLTAGRDLYQRGDRAEYFYILMSGTVSVYQKEGRGERKIDTLTIGDYFGEEALGKRARRPVTVRADEPAELLRLNKATLHVLTMRFPALRANLEIAISTHSLMQHTRLNWLNPDESVFLMARKHTYFLGEMLVGPILAGLGSLVLMALFFFAILPGTATPLIITGAIYLVSLGWGIWNYIDWGNDYNIVTSQRVVWQERVAGIYDSRQEAPLTTLLSVGTRTSQTGRWVGFGDVLVRTYTGTLTLHKVAHPQQIAALIEDHWTRSRRANHQAELELIEDTLRTRLDADETVRSQTIGPAGRAKTYHGLTEEMEPGFIQRLFATFFHLRFEAGGVITYRKHWFLLLQTTWLPMFCLLLTAILAFARLTNLFTLISTLATFAMCAGAGVVFALWFVYEYVDWRNDIYQITPDQIVDAEKTPLGREERKAAPLENILSIEYRRVGLLGLLLNFGTVTVTVGASKFNFEMVFNPSQVQQDVFRRMNERIEAKKQAEITAERERISDWIMIYHRNTHPAQADPPEEADLTPYEPF
jgi:membrane protein YdbS with pleckstrin-like domain